LWSNHAKSKTSSFESAPRQAPGARRDARAANHAVPKLSGAAHATSRLPQVWLLQRPWNRARGTNYL